MRKHGLTSWIATILRSPSVGFWVLFTVMSFTISVHAQIPEKCGTVLNSYRAIPVYSNYLDQFSTNDCDPKDKLPPYGLFGDQYQCTEFVKRFYTRALGITSAEGWTGNAQDYFNTAASKSLAPFSNGGTSPPLPGD